MWLNELDLAPYERRQVVDTRDVYPDGYLLLQIQRKPPTMCLPLPDTENTEAPMSAHISIHVRLSNRISIYMESRSFLTTFPFFPRDSARTWVGVA